MCATVSRLRCKKKDYIHMFRNNEKARHPGLRTIAWHSGLKTKAKRPGLRTKARHPGLKTKARHPGLMTKARHPGLKTEARHPGLKTKARHPGLRTIEKSNKEADEIHESLNASKLHNYVLSVCQIVLVSGNKNA